MIDRFFHYFSYLRFVAYVYGFYLCFSLFFTQTPNELNNMGLGLFLLGIAFSLEGLKTSREYSKAEIKQLTYGKANEISLLIGISCLCIPIFIGIFFLNIHLFFSAAHVDLSAKFKDIGYGSIAFGIGGISYFKERYNRLKSFKNAKKM